MSSAVLVSGLSVGSHVLLASARSAILATSSAGQNVDPYNVGSSTGGIWKSTNLGNTWQQVFSSSVEKMIFHPTTPSTIFAATAGHSDTTANILISINSGASFQATPLSPPAVDCINAGVTNAQNHVVAVSFSSSGTVIFSGIYFEKQDNQGNVQDYCYAFSWSSDSGNTWTAFNNVPLSSDEVTIGGQGM